MRRSAVLDSVAVAIGLLCVGIIAAIVFGIMNWWWATLISLAVGYAVNALAILLALTNYWNDIKMGSFKKL